MIKYIIGYLLIGFLQGTIAGEYFKRKIVNTNDDLHGMRNMFTDKFILYLTYTLSTLFWPYFYLSAIYRHFFPKQMTEDELKEAREALITLRDKMEPGSARDAVQDLINKTYEKN